MYDAVIVGGGPGGLAAALALGRGRKRVLLCDAGTPRNAAAERLHNFVTRDGTPPAEFRRIGRDQLATYPQVEVRDVRVTRITGEKGAFEISLGATTVQARRVVLCTGMIDQMLDIPGFRDFWGTAIFQCPYCHGWEVRDRRFAVLAGAPNSVEFAVFLKGWSVSVTLLTHAAFSLSAQDEARLKRVGVPVDTRPIRRLVGKDGHLAQVQFADGPPRDIDVIFAHPPQRQVDLVTDLGLKLDDAGYVIADPMTRETSTPGIYAGGDLTTRMQGAIMAAATGVHAAAMLNHELTVELVEQGALVDPDQR